MLLFYPLLWLLMRLGRVHGDPVLPFLAKETLLKAEHACREGKSKYKEAYADEIQAMRDRLDKKEKEA